MSKPVASRSRSVTNSPLITPKAKPSLSSLSVSGCSSPRNHRAGRHVQKLLENEIVLEETRKMLIDGQQKLIIIPAGGSGGAAAAGGKGHIVNGKLKTPQVKICSTNSSDSSDGRRTPPRRKRHHQQRHLNGSARVGGGDGGAAVTLTPTQRKTVSKMYSWRPTAVSGAAAQNLKVPDGDQYPSLRSLKTLSEGKQRADVTVLPSSPSLSSFTCSDLPVSSLRPLSDVVSVRSLISIGMGSTDGKKLVIRRVPTSPSDLLNFARSSPCGVTEDDFSSYSSLSDTLSDIDDHCKYRFKPRRQIWSNKLQFILACVSYSIGLGNLWRFPYLCYKSGGGSFLVPYFLIMLFCGVPLLYMELAIGQFTRRGPIGAISKLCPILKGAGISSVVVSFLLSTYYNVIIAYSLFYLFTALRNDQPWDHCTNKWNSIDCWTSSMRLQNKTKPRLPKTPAEEFYTNKVLQMSAKFENFGQVRWELVSCLLLVWVFVYFALWKSVRSSGKVLYFTATVPFVLVLIFLLHALSLEGSNLGLEYLFTPDWNLLLDSKVWVYAAAQNFNSIGIALGSVISFSSYNKFNNKIIHDTITVSCINAFTSLLVAVFAFATIGNIAWDQEEPVDFVVTNGPDLIFVVYPQALSKIPFASLWTILFFFTLLCLGLNSQFAVVEVTVTSLQDGFPNWIKRKLLCHEILVLVVCTVSFILGLPNVFQGGIYFFQLIDHYVASVSIIYIALFEVIAVAWIYGTKRIDNDVENMTKMRVGCFITTCWRVVTPLLLMCLWIFSLIDYEPPTYNDYSYPQWAQILGWMFTGVTLISVPIFAVYAILCADGDTILQKLRKSLEPKLDDYCNNHSDASRDSTKQTKELETLIEFKTPTLDNNSSNNGHCQTAQSAETEEVKEEILRTQTT